MGKITVPIKGMHCRSCEILIEKNLKKIPEISKVEVSHKTGLAEVYYHHNNLPQSELIKQAIKEAGYEVGHGGKLGWLSKDKDDYLNLLKGALILLVLYFLAKWLGLFNLAVNTESTSLFVVLTVGLVAGISTCMALVGGLVLGLSARHAELHPETTAAQKFRPHLYFNAGRIAGFAVLGGVIGLVGKVLSPSIGALGLLTVLVGGVMIFLGLKLIEIFPFLKNKSLSLPKSISKFFGLYKEQKEYSHKNSFFTGALTFFLPCGFTQAMQLYAVSSGSFLKGSLIMFLFAIGTAPGLLSIGGLASVFQGKKAKIFFSAAGTAVILLGWFNIANGSQLAFQGKSDNTDISGSETAEVQVIKMTQGNSGYSPSQFTVEKGKKIKWIITSTNQFSCASSLVVPKYGISKYLKKGENIIEFVPKETGQIPFSCSMGMYRGVINVVEPGSDTTSQNNLPTVANNNASQAACGGGGCGGCGGGGVKKPLDTTATQGQINNNEQLIRATYTLAQDIVPNSFAVKKGVPVRMEIDVKEDGQGCMSTVMIPGLYNDYQLLEGGQKMILNFTPNEEGDFQITCAMGVPRGVIKVSS